jgi:hypothetical protein
MKKIKNLLVTALFAATAVASATAAHAELVVDFGNYADTFTKASTGSDINIIGWQFTAQEKLNVFRLGYFDIDSGSIAHSVALYNAAGVQLASATIGSGQGTTSGFFRTVNIPSVFLDKGENYILAATVGDGTYTADTTGTFGGTNTFAGLQFNNVTYLSDVFDSHNNSLPTTWTSLEGGAATYGTFGPNMDANAVPEPGTVVLVGAGLLGLVAVRRKQNK